MSTIQNFAVLFTVTVIKKNLVVITKNSQISQTVLKTKKASSTHIIFYPKYLNLVLIRLIFLQMF